MTLVFILLILIFASGWLVSRLLQVKNIVEISGLSLLIGSFLLTIKMMVFYQVFGVFANWQIWFGEIIQLFVLIIIYIKRYGAPKFKKINIQLPQFTQLEKIMLIIIIGVIAYSGFSNLTWPVTTWDSIVLYDFRAQLIKQVSNWDAGEKLGYFYHYPPHTSLLHGAFYLLKFEKVKFWYTLIYASFLLLFYSLLKRKTSRKQAIFGSFLLSISPLLSEHITIAYTNMPHSAYLSLGIIYSWLWIDKNKNSDFVLSVIFTSASLWIRDSEPLWIIVLLILLYEMMFIKKAKIKTKALLFAGSFFIGLKYYWSVYISNIDTIALASSEQVGLLMQINLENTHKNLIAVAEYLVIYMFKPIILLVISLLIIIIFNKSMPKDNFTKIALGSIIFIFFMMAAGTLYFSFVYNTWDQIGDSLSRLIMFIPPLLIYLIAKSSMTRDILNEFPHKEN